MHRLSLISASAAIALCIACPSVKATVLTFDDLSGASFFTSTYKGFSFGNLNPATNDWYWSDSSSSIYQPHSGSTSVSTDSSLYNGLPLENSSPITSAVPFIFSGAYFSGASTNADGSAAHVEYKLYNNNQLVYTSNLSAALSSTSTFFASAYSGIVTGVVITGQQGYYAMDDFTFTAAPVPENSTVAMSSAGLALVGLVVARRGRPRARG